MALYVLPPGLRRDDLEQSYDGNYEERDVRSILSLSIYLNPCQSEQEKERKEGAQKPTSSNGRVSLKQLSHTSFTAFSAAASSGHAGFAFTESTARRRTQSYQKKNIVTLAES